MKDSFSKALRKASDKITDVSGGRDLADYVGAKIAQRSNPSVPQTTSGKDAIKSAAKVATTVGSLAGGGLLTRAIAKKVGTPKTMKIPGQKRPVKIKTGGKGGEIPQRSTWNEGGW